MADYFGPAGACDACGRTCCTLDQVGSLCYHCHAGVFMGRRWWTYWQDEDGVWWGTPREDIDLSALAEEWRRLGGRRDSTPLHHVVTSSSLAAFGLALPPIV